MPNYLVGGERLILAWAVQTQWLANFEIHCLGSPNARRVTRGVFAAIYSTETKYVNSINFGRRTSQRHLKAMLIPMAILDKNYAVNPSGNLKIWTKSALSTSAMFPSLRPVCTRVSPLKVYQR